MLSGGRSAINSSAGLSNEIGQLTSQLDEEEISKDLDILQTVFSIVCNDFGIARRDIVERDYYGRLHQSDNVKEIIAHHYLSLKSGSSTVRSHAHLIDEITTALRHIDDDIPDGDIVRMSRSLSANTDVNDGMTCIALLLIINGND